MKPNIVIFLLFLAGSCSAQNIPKAYYEYTKRADSLYNIKEYVKAISLYSKAFDTAGGQGKVKDRYSAACCWALSNNADSAFYQLYRIAVKGKYTNYDQILKEPNFMSLHTDKRWESLIEIMKKTRKEIEDAIQLDLQKIESP